MNHFIQLVSDLLISPAGGLVYHLILIFSIVAGLQICINYWDRQRAEWVRMLSGFSLLLLIQLLLFLFAVLAWQGLFDPGVWFPLIGRSASLLGLLVIIWMWCFPEPASTADTATIILGFFFLALTVLSGAYIGNNAAGGVISGSWIDFIFSLFSVLLAVFGGGLLVIRKTPGWETGLGQLSIFFLGYLSQLVWGSASGGYAAIIRLVELAAFPLLIALPQRYLERKGTDILSERPTQVELFELTKSVLRQPTPELIRMELTSQLARLFHTDFSLWVDLDEFEPKVDIRCAFDNQDNTFLDTPPVEKQAVPLFIKSMQEQRVLKLRSSSNAIELGFLLEVLKCDSPCNMLFVPCIINPHCQTGFLLVSTNTRRSWMDRETSVIQNIASPLVYFLHLTEQMSILDRNLRETEDRLLTLQASASMDQHKQETLQDENQRLLELDQEKKDRLETLALMISMQQDAISHYNARIMRLETDLEDQRKGFSHDQLDDILFQLEELQQPIQSIQENVDFLLEESMGVLGAMQRKHVERIKISGERAFQINDDILKTLSNQPGFRQNAMGNVDLGELIEVAVTEAIEEIKRKHIRLRMDLPEELPDLVSDGEVLQDVLASLMIYAGKVTPKQGEIILKAHIEEENGKVDYVILQITDGGEGIPPADLPHIFNPTYRIKVMGDKGAGDQEIDLSRVHEQVLALNGRIWLDNEPGKGSTISLLLPVFPIIHRQSNLPGELE